MKYSVSGKSKYGETSIIGKGAFAANAGLTLIEVLIAMVILLLGVYAVLKIFPAGLAVIEADRQRSVANSLAQAELERCKLLAENLYSLPEAIVAMDYDGNAITDYDPGDLTPAQEDYFTSGDRQPLWQPDSTYLPRVIIGEKTLIPAATGGIQLPFYLLQFAPLNSLTTGVVLQIYDATTFTRVGTTPLAQQYNVDNASGVFTLNVGYDSRYFAVSYSWIGTDGIVRNVIAESEQLVSGTFIVDAAGDALFQQLIPASEKVYLLYEDVTPAAPAASGEYRRAPTSLTTGIINFYSSDIGKAIGINYRVADWGIIREDYQIPASSAIPVRVAASGGIKGPGYTNPPRQPEEQLLPDGVNYVLAIDLVTGDIYGDIASDPTSLGNLVVDYRTGTIRFPTSTSSRTVRIYYRGRRDWMVQVQKAAAGYALSSTAGYDSFTWAGGKTLMFAPSEVGKTVSISYYRDVDGNQDGDYLDTEDSLRQYVTDELTTIEVGGAAAFCTGNYERPSQYNSFLVKGLSLTARAVWAGPGKSTVPIGRSLSGRQELLNETWLQNRVSSLLTGPMH